MYRFYEYRKAIIGEGDSENKGTLYMNPIPPGMVLKYYAGDKPMFKGVKGQTAA